MNIRMTESESGKMKTKSFMYGQYTLEPKKYEEVIYRHTISDGVLYTIINGKEMNSSYKCGSVFDTEHGYYIDVTCCKDSNVKFVENYKEYTIILNSCRFLYRNTTTKNDIYGIIKLNENNDSFIVSQYENSPQCNSVTLNDKEWKVDLKTKLIINESYVDIRKFSSYIEDKRDSQSKLTVGISYVKGCFECSNKYCQYEVSEDKRYYELAEYDDESCKKGRSLTSVYSKCGSANTTMTIAHESIEYYQFTRCEASRASLVFFMLIVFIIFII